MKNDARTVKQNKNQQYNTKTNHIQYNTKTYMWLGNILTSTEA